MPALKKKPSGKTTITLYAQEERQILGAAETLGFIELNTDGPLSSNAGVLSSGLRAVLHMLAHQNEKPKETQGELIQAEEKQDPNWKPMNEEYLDMGDDKKGAAK